MQKNLNLYTKMNGLGNSFVIFDARDHEIPFYPIIGNDISYDQLIIIERSLKADCRMRIYNIDGSSASACGNATRCVSRLLGGNQHSIEVGTRTLYTHNHEDGTVSVKMGIPLDSSYGIKLGEQIEFLPYIKGYVVDIGNPHVILFDQEPDSILGKNLENHEFFKDRINVNFVKIINSQTIQLTTWERGVGFTKACGTGACASAFMAHHLGFSDSQIFVNMEIGALFITIDAENVTMRGNAEFDGEGYV